MGQVRTRPGIFKAVEAWDGKSRCGKAGLGGQGEAWRGKVRQGAARRSLE